MKRYHRYHACVYPDIEVMIPKEHGEWVKWEDVKHAVAYYESYKNQVNAILNGDCSEPPKGMLSMEENP